MRLVENVVDDIVNLHVVSNVTGAVRNQHVAVGILDRCGMVGKGLLAEMESPARREHYVKEEKQAHPWEWPTDPHPFHPLHRCSSHSC